MSGKQCRQDSDQKPKVYRLRIQMKHKSSCVYMHRRFESRSDRDNFHTISTPSSYSTCPGLSIKWTGRRLVTDSGSKCAGVIHESKAVQIHVHSNRRCLYVPRVLVALKIRTTTTWLRRGNQYQKTIPIILAFIHVISPKHLAYLKNHTHIIDVCFHHENMPI